MTRVLAKWVTSGPVYISPERIGWGGVVSVDGLESQAPLTTYSLGEGEREGDRGSRRVV